METPPKIPCKNKSAISKKTDIFDSSEDEELSDNTMKNSVATATSRTALRTIDIFFISTENESLIFIL